MIINCTKENIIINSFQVSVITATSLENISYFLHVIYIFEDIN